VGDPGDRGVVITGGPWWAHDREDATGPAAASPGYFRAVAVDFDGTLADSDRPHPDALAALAKARADGLRVLIVTGRILADLRSAFPDADDYADVIIAENGAVLASGGEQRTLAVPVPDELAAALAEHGVACRRGDVLLACDGSHEPAVLAEVRRLGLECQLVRNRGALMVLPSGVSKGAGLAAGLAELGISCHNTIAIGDAENDHSLLAAAELAVATGNAVASLKSEADLVTAEADGQGVASLLRGPVLARTERAHSKRWRIDLGHLLDGSPVSIPASGVNVLVTGTPQQGKSYLAGLIAERLIRLGYSVVIIDPEGDHAGLRRLPGVIVTGADGRLLAPDDLARLVRQHPGGVVVDLSAAPAEGRARYLSDANRELEALRAQTGLPHWIILDEAQVPLAKDTDTIFESATTGYCLVTYRPGELRPEALLAIDVLIVLPEGTAASHTADLLAATAAMPHAAAAALIRQATPGQAVLAERHHPGAGQLFTIGHRETAHMRHWHKYFTGQLSNARRFYFRRDPATATGSTASSAPELARELARCEDQAISHHCWHEDFSRWVHDVLGDPPLATAIAQAEQQARSGASPASTRTALIDAIHARYPR
jgi:hydroxymethylpyrimidine pyrophosphatase-like HAD family hydrolase